jgi:hypothetical protein
MKKFSTSIFLSAVGILALISANFAFVQKPGTGAVCLNVAQHSINSNSNLPESEIERSIIISSNILNAHPVFHKTPGHTSSSLNINFISARITPLTTGSYIDLFDNNNLSYNYPFHSFW